MTKKKAMKLHKDLWNWLAKNPHLGKADWPWWEKHGRVLHLCFACELASEEGGSRDESRCLFCPISWPGGYCEGNDDGEETWFESWCRELDDDSRSWFARKIANLPWK